jgi:hypothetical protein
VVKVVAGKGRWEKMDKTMARETMTTVKEVKTKGDGKRLGVLSLRGGWVGLPFSWGAFMLGGGAVEVKGVFTQNVIVVVAC